MSDQKKSYPCPLCEARLDVRYDAKHGKPYVICDACGLQMFIRREKGIRLFDKRAKKPPMVGFFD